ncbi:consortin, connexin sorting protein b isoform X2 [Esox lucius]|uniref:Consortin C-terminal domain-containing protein n=1 Tax=Esox lucius TaxID=8010 RepID=A0A3P8Y3N2_ESOLU|nr:consortin, connexin sorting protein b isoform X2 [Esox lucius]
MGNKSTSPPGDLKTEMTKQEANNSDITSGRSPRGTPGPSPDLLASLQTLGEHSDHTLLPQSLHQIAEAYSLEEDYQWAVQFLQLERLYHERLLSNLAALQEDWERQWRERNRAAENHSIGQEHIEILSQICRTHKRPMVRAVKSMDDAVQKDIHNTRGQCEGTDRETSPSHYGKVTSNTGRQTTPTAADPADGEGEEEEGGEKGGEEEGVEEVDVDGQEVDEEEVFEESPEEEVKVVEWPAGVPQASAKDLVKLSHVDESTSPDGLVSILKRRRASLDGLPPEGPDTAKQNSKRKVRFSEPEDGMEPDEMGGDSCLILLLLCLVTVVISLGGTALYCALVDTYSNICTDFSHNLDFYLMYIQRFLDGFKPWLPLRS